jgi:protein-L-isoaspartate O-methyltransferase
MVVAVLAKSMRSQRQPDDVVLEIGTGLGYQSAVLAELAGRVYSVEMIDELAQRAAQRLKRQGYTNVEVRVANGGSSLNSTAIVFEGSIPHVTKSSRQRLVPDPPENRIRAH